MTDNEKEIITRIILRLTPIRDYCKAREDVCDDAEKAAVNLDVSIHTLEQLIS